MKIRAFGPGSLSIAQVLGLAIGGLVLLAVLAVLAIQLFHSRTNVMELLNKDLGKTFHAIGLALDDQLAPAAEQIEFLARQIEAGRYGPAERERLADLLTGALAATPQIARVVFVDEKLRLLGARQDRDRMPEIYEFVSGARPRLESIAAEMAATEGARWGELVHFDDRTYLNLRRPVRRGGRYLGFLAVLVGTDELSQIVTDIGEAQGATPFILYGDDRVLAHPNLTSTHPDLSEAAPLARVDRVGDLVLAAIPEGVPMHGFGGPRAGGITVLRLEVDGGLYIAALRWIDGYGATPWRIGGWLPMESAMGAMKRMRDAALAGVAIAILAVILAVALGRALARPIRRAAVGSARIATLDLEHVEELPPSTIAELNEQAGAFNATLGALRSFATYVPRRLVARLIHGGRDGARDGAATSHERELTVLFTDIAGFTAMSERMPAREVADFLNEHFTLLARCVEDEEGTIDKYIGDSLMAFWGAPDEQEDHARRACRAAQAIARAVEADNAARAAAGQAPVRIRVGVHSGPAVVGDIGAPGRINYTIVGDTVNISQRLESLGRDFDRGEAVTVLISGATARAVEEDFTLESVGSCPVKGREEEIPAFRLTPS